MLLNDQNFRKLDTKAGLGWIGAERWEKSMKTFLWHRKEITRGQARMVTIKKENLHKSWSN